MLSLYMAKYGLLYDDYVFVWGGLGTWDALRTIPREEGLGGMYRGASPALARAMCTYYVTFVETFSLLLSCPDTNFHRHQRHRAGDLRSRQTDTAAHLPFCSP